MKGWNLEFGSWNFKKTARLVILVIYFLSTLSLSVGTSFFNSPDENANFVFAEQFANKQTFKINDSINLELAGIVHPRSSIALADSIVPISFLGLPFIAGLIGSVFGSNTMLWITPLLALLSILAWRSLILKFTDNKQIADLSALFLMIHPAFWLYSARVMMHNVGFVAFLILSLWFAFVGIRSFCSGYEAIKGEKILDWSGSGIMLGLALSFRTSEIIWLTIITIALLIVYRKFVSWKNLGTFLISLLIVLSGFGALNYSTYGSPFETGYTIKKSDMIDSPQLWEDQEGQIDEVDAIDHIINVIPFANYLFPFGFHERNIINNVWAYGFLLYPWMTVLAIVGLIFVVREKKWREYIWITLGLSVWLAIVYGSWKFNDNPDAGVITLGNSYVRYWLPLFVLGSAFCAVGVQKISELAKNKWQMVIKVTIVILMTISSSMLVLYGEDGLVKTRQSLVDIQVKHDIIIEQTSEDSIIIVDMVDKYLWPDRRVVMPLRSELTYSSIPKMLELADVYYFGITFPESDINYLNDVKLKNLGAQIEEIVEIGDETLYRVKND
ncbi:hypothetical protein CO057_03295 [Candidatus Uhrbacteria bacterium CG_4_9_14_0_2_um_filter_41_50]|uniref:Glycosyltransferase RgtA/B/C/D-like domain-containing protein n=1 Tax=Candidatus Uhrbacteria bacterium CG_4_9_14_0_2_um_filter_41_50 TaxID=1975031 RepID=A0A2M8ENK3_9BACT|nr:MAG: hypothetical protein COZ45_03575 [Candidatus Uhrbacteria bacterium CG_4_10_14_3_um_filter_41_21]PIZ55113.1 MAG: hypothetical protein COY24_01620 [Candidatus Uhrbacteria bacterium CG_4_10_14_0_2_um_filter_41_21]PJB84443.1 MAG: hypothetical protein CO086_03745 [Candidatus Uhrbacteria bacterium CG_4_9_14_0_8_um_filter_41_16]PJC24324.1 MAG: hypothetical protein CO057_03295 [Candidatus Uhrbacteria bacterium CG_4_9_14_0_2_um_filter_41_50]PJE75313.1 MAG: hypothetical protein COV03_00910 [Candi